MIDYQDEYMIYKGVNATIEVKGGSEELLKNVDYLERKIRSQTAFKNLVYVTDGKEGYLILDGVGEFYVKPEDGNPLKFRILKTKQAIDKAAAYNVTRLESIDLSSPVSIDKLMRAVMMADV